MASKKKKSICKDHLWSKWGKGVDNYWFGHGRCTRTHRVCLYCRRMEWKTIHDK